MALRNLTGRRLDVMDASGEVRHIEPDGQAIAKTYTENTRKRIQDVPIYMTGLTGEVEGMPNDLRHGERAIVPLAVAQALPEDAPVLTPGAPLRNSQGQVIGARGLKKVEHITPDGPTNSKIPTNPEANIVNLTPHDVNIVNEDGTINKTFETSGTVARLREVHGEQTVIDGIEVTPTSYGTTDGLPEPKDDTYYIVSPVVAMANPSRSDLLSPHGLVKDENGRILGSKGLAIHFDREMTLDFEKRQILEPEMEPIRLPRMQSKKVDDEERMPPEWMPSHPIETEPIPGYQPMPHPGPIPGYQPMPSPGPLPDHKPQPIWPTPETSPDEPEGPDYDGPAIPMMSM